MNVIMGAARIPFANVGTSHPALILPFLNISPINRKMSFIVAASDGTKSDLAGLSRIGGGQDESALC